MNFNLDISTTSTAPLPTKRVLRRELLTHIDGDDYLMVLDNTSAEKLTTCPKSAEYYLLNRREPTYKSAALVFGGALHAGLEQHLLGSCATSTPSEAITAYFADNPAPVTDYRTPELCLAVMDEYLIRSSFPDYAFDEILLVERAFELPLCVLPVQSELQLPSWDAPRYVGSVHVAWSGKIDAIVRIGDKLLVMDHKTTSLGGDSFVQDFRLAQQTRGYCWAASQILAQPVSSFVGNAFHIKKPTGSGRLTAPGPRGGQPALQMFRFFFDYTEESLAEWEVNTSEIISDLLACLDRRYFPMHHKWCFGKYGACGYHDVCTQQKSVRPNLLASDLYQDVTWDPTRT